MYIKGAIEFEKPYFDDLEPEVKSKEEIFIIVLRNASGENISQRKYSDNELNSAARQLILNGYLRGTIFDKYSCSWSRPTGKGRILLDFIKKERFNFSKS